MKIVLIGFMGSGKSTTAKILSGQLQIPLIEMDDLVYKKTKTENMHEVFAKGGEKLLRKTEALIAEECAAISSAVISTGGGAIVNSETMHYLKKGKIFFLNVPFEHILKRLEQDKARPLFLDKARTKALYEDRLALYLEYADHTIDASEKSPEQIACVIKQKCFYGL